MQRPVIAFGGLLILLFIVTALSADAAEFITSDGKVHQGEVEWRDNAFLVQGQVVAPETMVEVRFNPPPQKTDATGTMLTLVDGSVQKARITSSSLTKGLRIGGGTEVQSLVAGGVLSTNPEEHVPLSNIQSISFNPVRGTTAPKIPPFKDGQVHIVRIDGTVATGEFSYITSLLVGAKINGKRERFRRNALAAIHFRPPAAPKGDGVLVRTTLGARILGGMDELTSDGLAVKTSLGEVKIAMKNLISIERVGSHITPLSELQPATKKVMAFLDLVHPPQMNKDLFGFPLRAGAVTYDKGIAMHSRTELVFETKGAALFVGMVGLDTRYSRVGTANLTISLDGKPVSNVELAAGDPFQFIQLPLGNSKRLGLVLDFGELGSAGDHALILNPRLVKN